MLAAVAASAAAFGQTSTFNRVPWLEDFQQLLQEMSSHYANLEWALNERHMDLPHLRQETENALQHAHDDAEARRVLGHFVDAFGDGHLEIDWPKPDSDELQPAADAPLCQRLGYKTRGKEGIEFRLVPGFSLATRNQPFLGGLLKVPTGKSFGVIRLGVVTEKAFPEACQEAVRQLHLNDHESCNESCANKIELGTANVLTAALTARATELRRAGAQALIIDITHNGGGSDWVEAAVRALSPKPLRDSRFAFIKDPHWTSQLEDQLKDVETDLAKHRQPSDLLLKAQATLNQAIAASKQTCDRTQLWTTGKLNCSLLEDLLYTSGILDYSRSGSFAGLESRTTLFHPARYEYTESSSRLPLYVVVDSETWSAAEYFAALLQDNKAATIIGELTGGAGCGYTNGGIPTQLKNSKAEVKMPDCVRLRADGSDEVNGITPDILVPWAPRDSAYQRVQKLVTALESLQ